MSITTQPGECAGTLRYATGFRQFAGVTMAQCPVCSVVFTRNKLQGQNHDRVPSHAAPLACNAFALGAL